ncbi:MAG: Uma2 family endonuclease [Treponemataceae bacterium]
MIRNKVDGMSTVKPDVHYTVADYKTWPDEERWELINGIAYSMSPAPRSTHQRISRKLFSQIDGFLVGKPCELFYSPIDVYLSDPDAADDQADTVVQPDILVVCDPSKVVDEGIRGAPDFIVEILSDSTAYKDLNEKKTLYETHGVREYWIVKPSDGSVLAWHFDGTRFAPVKEYRGEEPVDSVALPGFIWSPRT